MRAFLCLGLNNFETMGAFLFEICLQELWNYLIAIHLQLGMPERMVPDRVDTGQIVEFQEIGNGLFPVRQICCLIKDQKKNRNQGFYPVCRYPDP